MLSLASAKTSQIPVRYLSKHHGGLASVRNHGIQEARDDLLLMGDDDIIPGPTLVAEHLAWNEKYSAPNFGILGSVAWSLEVHPTPFMEWLGLDGVPFGFGRLSREREVPFDSTHFCSTSIKRNFLIEDTMFDKDFQAYGCEDPEFSYRLAKKGCVSSTIHKQLGTI